MKLVMTLLVRNEADIIDDHIAFHLDAGVDFVVATDNDSDDETVELLERHARTGHLHLIHEEGDSMNQGAWVTRMARVAAKEFGADWIINSDADEFWCSRRGSLKDLLAEIPRRFATVRAFLRSFVPRPERDDAFAERMTARLVPGELPPMSVFRDHPFHAQDKVIHRGHPEVTVRDGNHDARWAGSIDLRGWWPIEVLHFPIRALAQCERKWGNWERHHYSGYEALQYRSPRDYYQSRLVDDETLADGVAAGWLVLDSRLRDGGPFPAPTLEADAAYAADITAAADRDSLVRMGRRLRELDGRLSVLEGAPWRRLDKALR